ncbi:hypothetical protein CEXT_227961 [Caerostris extrusa]|uniref:Uncharacterized protein n=1 Tax=Caerostris extrusa TaxID=172846 RepID=A0AAV4NNQ3_CAEEX|nr:hypothetical protein CEXT_227961 [Caerostris extrusa]
MSADSRGEWLIVIARGLQLTFGFEVGGGAEALVVHECLHQEDAHDGGREQQQQEPPRSGHDFQEAANRDIPKSVSDITDSNLGN